MADDAFNPANSQLLELDERLQARAAMTLLSTARGLLLLTLVACAGDNGVGLPCVLSQPASASQSVIETPALDCTSRMCVQFAPQQPALCTAECGQVGQACTPSSNELCMGEFRCEVPFRVGPFADLPLCVCAELYSAVAD